VPSGETSSLEKIAEQRSPQSLDSPSSSQNFRSVWKKFAAKSTPADAGGPRSCVSGKPAFFQKDAKITALSGRPYVLSGKPRGFFHLAAIARTKSRHQNKVDGGGAGGTGGLLLADGSTSPRVTRSQSKRKKKDSPKHSPSEEPPAPVRKSQRKKTANSKYDVGEGGALTPKGKKKEGISMVQGDSSKISPNKEEDDGKTEVEVPLSGEAAVGEFDVHTESRDSTGSSEKEGKSKGGKDRGKKKGKVDKGETKESEVVKESTGTTSSTASKPVKDTR